MDAADVEAERDRRGLSVREAAALGGVANTTWARYEDGGPITGKMRRAVAAAFKWDTGWPEREASPAVASDYLSRLDALERQVKALALHAVAAANLGRIDVQQQRTTIDELVALLDQWRDEQAL